MKGRNDQKDAIVEAMKKLRRDEEEEKEERGSCTMRGSHLC